MNLPVYLDHNATTPADPRVIEAMLPYFTQIFGNPGSLNHKFGWEAKAAVDIAREQVADLIGASPDEIIFTSGTTESNNLVLNSFLTHKNASKTDFIFSPIEHKSVLDPVQVHHNHSEFCHFLTVDGNGTIDFSELESKISQKTALVSVIYANNEIGTIQNVQKIGKLAKENGAIFFSDAAQAVGKIQVNVKADEPDILTISGHKMYGPKGVGAIYNRRKNPRVTLFPMIFGGGQEKAIRSGTLNVPGIVGLGKACEIAKSDLEHDYRRMVKLRDWFEKLVSEQIPDVKINGNKENRLPNTTNLTFQGIKSSNLSTELKKIAVSSGSACLTSDNEPSYVLKAIGLSDESARKSIRIGIGRFTTEEEIKFSAGYLIETVRKLS